MNGLRKNIILIENIIASFLYLITNLNPPFGVSPSFSKYLNKLIKPFNSVGLAFNEDKYVNSKFSVKTVNVV